MPQHPYQQPLMDICDQPKLEPGLRSFEPDPDEEEAPAVTPSVILEEKLEPGPRSYAPSGEGATPAS